MQGENLSVNSPSPYLRDTLEVENGYLKNPLTPIGGQIQNNRIFDKLEQFGLTMAQALIIANGDIPENEKWTHVIDANTTVIACDGAIHKCYDRGVNVDVLIGDLDSIEKNKLLGEENFEGATIHITDQEDNDLMKAINYAIEQQFDNIVLTGILGGNQAHQFANLLSVGITMQSLTVIHAGGIIRNVNKFHPFSHSIEIGGRFSVFSINNTIGVSITGSKWNLSNVNLPPSARGLNNVATSETIDIACQEGNLLVFIDG